MCVFVLVLLSCIACLPHPVRRSQQPLALPDTRNLGVRALLIHIITCTSSAPIQPSGSRALLRSHRPRCRHKFQLENDMICSQQFQLEDDMFACKSGKHRGTAYLRVKAKGHVIAGWRRLSAAGRRAPRRLPAARWRLLRTCKSALVLLPW